MAMPAVKNLIAARSPYLAPSFVVSTSTIIHVMYKRYCNANEQQK